VWPVGLATERHASEPDNRREENEVKQRIHVVTLAVEDLERALAFYRDGLGLESVGIVGTEYVGDDDVPNGALALFELERGLMLALYPRVDLAKDADVPATLHAPGAFSIGHAVTTRDEVDELLARAEAAGGRLTGPPHDRPWGIYSGYFEDLDGHLWEILWNPGLSDV
jgi:catechol 2,3-dioxygenase-like lactoylglutathione lyase family enzyme